MNQKESQAAHRDKLLSDDDLLRNALKDAKYALLKFAQKDSVTEKLSSAFGKGFDSLEAENLYELLQSSSSVLPEVELVSSERINGALSAYSSATGKIFIARDFLSSASLENLTSVLLESFGHAIDERLSSTLASGDEGELFAKLIMESNMSAASSQTEYIVKKEDGIPLPISSENRDIATMLAAEQKSAAVAEYVKQKLIAVLSVRDYLSFQGYIPDLEASDCWNPILRQLSSCGDLVVSQIGRIECCPFARGQMEYEIPLESQFDRVAYVAIEIGENERWATLLGFIPADSEDGGVTAVKRQDLFSPNKWGEQLQRLWLLWKCLEEREEPWNKELRTEVTAILDKIYRTGKPSARARLASQELAKMWIGQDTESEPIVVKSREFGIASGTKNIGRSARELWNLSQDIFDELDDILEEQS